MKFEDAVKKIKGAESVGGQLIVNRGGRNVLVGKSVQGTLIVEDTDEAKSIVFEVDKKAYEVGQDADEDAEEKSILSTHPAEAALRSTEPMPNVNADDAVDVADSQSAQYDAETRREDYKPPKGSDPNTPKPNTAETKDADKGSKK